MREEWQTIGRTICVGLKLNGKIVVFLCGPYRAGGGGGYGLVRVPGVPPLGLRCTPGYHMTGLSALRNLRSAFTWPGLQPAKTPSCRMVGISLLERAGNWIVRGRGTWIGRLCLRLKVRNVIAWAGASLRAEAQVTFPHKYPQPCKGETPSAPCLNPSPTS